MLKAFELEKDPGVNAEGLLLQRHHRRPADVHGDSPACILNFSARDHSVCLLGFSFRPLVFMLVVATGGLGSSSTVRRKISGRE